MLHNFYNVYSIPENRKNTTNYGKAAPIPLSIDFTDAVELDLLTEALIKAWSRKQFLLACKT